MTTDAQTAARPAAASAQADLAFLRALAEGDGRPEANQAKAMLSGGLIYGAQCLFHWAEFSFDAIRLPPSLAAYLFITIAPSILWLGCLIWINRRAGTQTPTAARKAIRVAFQGVGLVSVVVLPITGLIAIRQDSLSLLFIHAVVVFAAIGAAWYVSFRLTRRMWALWVAAGWLASAASLGVAAAYDDLAAVFGVASIALFVLMALPGAILLREAGKEES